MTPHDIRTTFADYFRERGHRRIPSHSLVPPDPDDPVLLITSGMHPLTPYLEGRPHPLGTRLVGSQRCVRTTDLDEVGDDSHLTLFEMLGSWSLGDYSHEQSLRWGQELLTESFGIDPALLGVTVFGGSPECPPDDRSTQIWRELGYPDERIGHLGDDNWWSNGPVGLCGPDSEQFVWTGTGEPAGVPGVHDGWREIWNHVSMRFRRSPSERRGARSEGRAEGPSATISSGELTPLSRRCVDTGLGFERLVALMEGVPSVWDTSLLRPWTETVGGLWGLAGVDLRIVSDHLRSSSVLVGDGVRPGSSGRGYVLRRLLRRSLLVLRRSGGLEGFPPPTGVFHDLVDDTLRWFEVPGSPSDLRDRVVWTWQEEGRRLDETLRRGRREVSRLLGRGQIGESEYRWLWDTHGVPREVVDDLLEEDDLLGGLESRATKN